MKNFSDKEHFSNKVTRNYKLTLNFNPLLPRMLYQLQSFSQTGLSRYTRWENKTTRKKKKEIPRKE